MISIAWQKIHSMISKLGQEQRAHYSRNGFVFPLKAITGEHANRCNDYLQSYAAEELAQLTYPWRYKSYLLFTWVYDLVTHPRILDAVESVLGPDLRVLSADIWDKPPSKTRYISWHQDASYWLMNPLEITTVWIALTPTTPENGCMQFIPGSHTNGLHIHVESDADENILSKGQSIDHLIDKDTAVCCELKPGEFSMHSPLLAHASGPNHTSTPRIGIAIRYLSASVAQIEGPPLSCLLVRGNDPGLCSLENRPDQDLSDKAKREHHKWLKPHEATQFVCM